MTVGLQPVVGPRPSPFTVTTGEEVFPRNNATHTAPMTSGVVRWSYFQGQQTVARTQVVTCSGTTAAGATPTLCRVGVYSVAANGDLTKLAETANTTTLWATITTEYVTNLSSNFDEVLGIWYALGVICVTAAAAPLLAGAPNLLPAATSGRAPKLGAALGSQADLPASATNAQAAASSTRPFAILL